MPSGGMTCADVVHDALRRQRKPILRRPFGEVGKDAFAQTQQCLTIGQLAFEAIGQRLRGSRRRRR